MPTKKRFAFWKTFWVVLAVYLFILLLALLAMIISTPATEKIHWEYMLNKWHLISQGVNVLGVSIFFYFTLNYFHFYFVDRRGFIDFLRVCLFAAIGLGFYFYAKNNWFLPQAMSSTEKKHPAAMMFFIVMFTSAHLACSLLIAYLTYLRDEKKRQKILEEQKMQLEVEKSSANLNFLKAQINPHFLHNTLNFLYAKSIPYSAELSEGILTLSDIMRYALSEGNARDGKAPLRDEIEHVWNVIKINQLRFSNKLNVEFNVQGLVDGVTIIPFVLITIVENAFKHGDLMDQQHPIHIELEVGNRKLAFTCSNKKKTGPKELSTGVGLDNIKKRLDLAYGDRYHFNVKDDGEFYSTELIIDQI